MMRLETQIRAVGVIQPLTFISETGFVCSLTKSSFYVIFPERAGFSPNFLDSDPNKPVASAYSTLCDSVLFLIPGGICLTHQLCFIFLYFIYHGYGFEVSIAPEYKLSHLVQEKSPLI